MAIKRDNGSKFSCGEKITNLPTAGGLSFIVTNYSQNTATITGVLIPKDAAGNESLSAKTETNITITPAVTAFFDYSAFPLEIKSDQSSSFHWESAPGVDGINFMYDCSAGPAAFISKTANFDELSREKCNTPIFAAPKQNPPDIFLYFKNTNTATITVPVILIPYIGNFYESRLSKIIEIVVKPPEPVQTAYPAINELSVSPTKIQSGETAVISWRSANTSGVNLRIENCTLEITYSITSPDNFKSCDFENLFEKDLPPSGSQSIKFHAIGGKKIRILAIPAASPEKYDTIRGRIIEISTESKSLLPIETKTAPAVFQEQTQKSQTTKLKPLSFTRNLYYGLRNNSDVKLLQEVLIKEKVYAGPVTGNFFSLTLKGVKNFQAKYGIPTTGFVGFLTRGQLNFLGY